MITLDFKQIIVRNADGFILPVDNIGKRVAERMYMRTPSRVLYGIWREVYLVGLVTVSETELQALIADVERDVEWPVLVRDAVLDFLEDKQNERAGRRE